MSALKLTAIGTSTGVIGSQVGGYFANPIWDFETDYYWLKNSTSSSSSGLGG